jgi:hypothetical protein
LVYRPTVRYSDVYADYVDAVASATKLERTQVIRLALFSAAHSEAFKEILNEYRRPGEALPSPSWELYEDVYFLEKDPKPAEGKGVGVYDDTRREDESTPAAAEVTAGRSEAAAAQEVKLPPAGHAGPLRVPVRKKGGGIRIVLKPAAEN